MSSNSNSWDSKTLFHRFSILAVSLVITIGTAISPALPAMAKTFSNYPVSLVNTVATIQQVPAFIVLLFSASISRKLGMKNCIGLGLLIMGISGVIPAFIPNLWVILVSRAVFGIGIGLLNSLAITMVNLFYDGADRSQMLGNRSSFEQVGLCIMNIAIGLLLNISWQFSFLAYIVIFAVLALFWFIVPPFTDNSNVQVNQANPQDSAKQRVNFKVIAAGVICCLLTMGMAAVSILTPSIVVNAKMGTATDASFVITIFTLTSMVMGFLFGKIFKLIKRFVFSAGMLFLSIGMLLMNGAHTFPMLIVSVMVIGCAFPLAGNYLFNLMEVAAPKGSNALANSVLLVGCNIGTAVSPTVISALGSVSPFKGEMPGIGLFGALIIALMIILIIFQIISHTPNVSNKRNKYTIHQ
ncbi:MFS transporter [Lactobacillus sp. Sy-1]|uniref:MFS transporter n=1 Tax=Lactobacillus sp. Sy-1 TaxID=2109645 RepID=UPI001C590F5F|nr:MFS transporter [Lactobacillus sp. Sy-1]MBW1605200.1 MFS transporter [Lactobacillus sp. Sy-1]